MVLSFMPVSVGHLIINTQNFGGIQLFFFKVIKLNKFENSGKEDCLNSKIYIFTSVIT